MAFTKVVGAGIHTQSNIDSHNINSTGIITATKFDGPFDNIVIGGGGLNITGVVTSTGLDVNGNGDISGNLVVGGNLTANGDFTTLNTTLREVELLRVDANSSVAAGIITQRGSGDILKLYDNTTEVFSVADGGAVTTGDHITLTGQNPRITFTDTNHNPDFEIYGSAGIFQIWDSTNAVGRLVVNSNGNVGINSTIPAAKLDVNGTSKFQDNVSFTTANGNGIIISKSNNYMMFGNSVTQYFGGSAMWLMHNGSTGYLHNVTGGLYIRNEEDNGHIYIQGKSGADSILAKYEGAVELYWNGTKKFETGDTVNTNLNHFEITSGQQLRLDNSNNNRSSEILNDGSSGNSVITFKTNGGNRWTIDSSGHLLPGAVGSYDIGSTGAEIGDVYLADDKRLKLGSDQDMLVYHDNIHGYVSNRKANLYLQAPNYVMITSTDTSGSNMQTGARFLRGGKSEIYHSDSVKFETSGTGITVTGEVAASQDYPNFRPTLDFNFAAEKKLDPRITYSRSGPASFTNEFGKVVIVGDNVPRFDHDPITRECKGLLIEESRTNIFASSDPAKSAWLLDGGITKGANTTETTAPDGTFTACKLMSAASANSYSQIYDGLSRYTGGVQSLWVKKGTHNVIGIFDYSGGSGIRGWFDVNTGEHRCEGGSKVAAGVQSNGNDTNNTNMVEYPNGWYRYIYYEAANMSYAHFRIVDFDSDNEASASSNSIYLWGLQAEDNNVKFATSFIPCDTGLMPGTITRGTDFAKVEGEEFAEFYNNATEHTTVMVGKRLGDTNTDGRLYTISNGTSSQVAPDWDFNDDTKLRISSNVGGSSQMVQELNPFNERNDEFKIAAGMAVNNQIGVVNGTAIAAADTSCLMPTGVDRLYFGLRGDEGNQGSLTIKRFMFYPKRLPDSQLVTLTS